MAGSSENQDCHYNALSHHNGGRPFYIQYYLRYFPSCKENFTCSCQVIVLADKTGCGLSTETVHNPVSGYRVSHRLLSQRLYKFPALVLGIANSPVDGMPCEIFGGKTALTGNFFRLFTCCVFAEPFTCGSR